MTNCDKCTSVHIAQEKGLQSKPCECDCHNRGEILCAVPFHIPKLTAGKYSGFVKMGTTISETRQAHHPPNCDTIHKYYTKPLKSVK